MSDPFFLLDLALAFENRQAWSSREGQLLNQAPYVRKDALPFTQVTELVEELVELPDGTVRIRRALRQWR